MNMHGDEWVICPYFIRQGKNRRTIVCEGPNETCNGGLQFHSEGDKVRYMEDFCRTHGCWQGCPVAIAAAEKQKEP
jgi:hypothetical protein